MAENKQLAYEHLPHSGRMELVDLRKWVEETLVQYEGVINKDDKEGILHQFRDVTGNWAFNISYPELIKEKGTLSYAIYFRPHNLTSLSGVRASCPLDLVKGHFIEWIGYVKKMHEVDDEYYNPEQKFFSEEFIKYFSNNEPDARSRTYDQERQKLLYHFIGYAEKTIAQSTEIPDESKTEIIDELRSLKHELPRLTKSRFVKWLSKIAHKIILVNNGVYYEIFDALLTPEMLLALAGTTPMLPDAFSSLKKILHLE
jgi:hypothetical protein